MEVILASIFSAIIIFIAVFYMIKAFIIAYKRNEISLRKFIVFSTSSIVIGILVASVLPFGYQKIIDYIY
jgi:FtsH-binding integral membrane protein